MGIHACFLAAMLLVGASAGATMDRAEPFLPADRALLIAGHEALAGIKRLCVVVAARESRDVGQWVDLSKQHARVVERLLAAGIEHIDCKTGLTPRLLVSIEGLVIPDCRRCVYRVQTSLNRVVTFSNHRDLHVQAEVWRLRPVMQVVAEDQAPDAIAAAVLTQVDAFIGLYKAAQRLRPRSEDAAQKPSVAPTASRQDLKDAVARLPLLRHAFVASASSAVFHRPDCRWAQNISETNLVGYRTRDEAVQAGKRPCKSCKP